MLRAKLIVMLSEGSGWMQTSRQTANSLATPRHCASRAATASGGSASARRFRLGGFLLAFLWTRVCADDDWVVRGVYKPMRTDQKRYHAGMRGKFGRLFNDTLGHWHGQQRQDQAVYVLLGEKKGGYFIDLAANHWIQISNSRALERDHGWTGVCIEGDSRLISDLVMFRKCVVVNAIVSSEAKAVQFYQMGPRSGGALIATGTDKQDSAFRRGIDISTTAARFDTILRSVAAPRTIDFLSLDVEGAEDLVMEGFPFDQHIINVIVVERPKPSLRRQLQNHDYTHICGTEGLDEYWVHKSFAVPPETLALLTQGHNGVGPFCTRGVFACAQEHLRLDPKLAPFPVKYPIKATPPASPCPF